MRIMGNGKPFLARADFCLTAVRDVDERCFLAFTYRFFPVTVMTRIAAEIAFMPHRF